MRMRLFFILGLIVALAAPAAFATLTQSWRIDSAVAGPVYQDNTNRGMGYNPVTDRVLLVRTTGPTVRVYDNAGAFLGNMSVAGIAGGTFTLNKVRAIDRGASGYRVYGANTVTDNKVASLTIYQWTGAGAGSSETTIAAPTVIYRNRASDAGVPEPSPVGPTMPAAGANTYRLGDTLGAIYNSGTDTTSLYFTISTGETQKRVYRFDIVEATGVVTITDIPLTGATGGTGYGATPTAVGGNMFVFMGERARYSSAGGSQQTFLGAGGGATCTHPTYATVGAVNYLGYVDGANSLLASSAFRRFAVSRVTDVGGNVLVSQYEIGPALTGAASIANANGTGDVQFDTANGRVYALVSNNYLGRFDISTPAVSTVLWDGGGALDNWDDPLNWAPDGVPGSNNDVVLDNTNVGGSYTVEISSINQTALCRTVQVGYAGNANTIGLRVTATAGPGIALNVAGQLASPDATTDFVLEQGGRFENLSTTSAGNVVNNLNTNNTASIRSGSYFLHNTARAFSGVFPITGNGAASFLSGSTLEFAQASGTTATFSGRTYGNFTLSATAAKTYTASGTSGTTILNDLTLGTNVTFNPTMTVLPLTFQGNIVNNGSGGAISNTGGVIFGGTTVISGAGTALTWPTGFTVNPANSLTTGQAMTIPAAQAAIINGTMTANAAITVNGTLQCSSNTVAGTGSVAVNAGATLTMGNAGGVDGQITAAGPNVYNTGANYNYVGSVAQVTGASLPSTINNTTINNAAGVTLSGPVTVGGVLNLFNGELITGANTLTAQDGGAAITRTAGFVRGTLTRNINAASTGPRSFPVGTAAEMSSVEFDITGAGSGTGTLAVGPTATDHPNVYAAAGCIDRYWDLTASGIAGFAATLSFRYQQADVTGSVVEAGMAAGRYTGSGTVWQLFTPTLDTTNNIATVTGVTTLSPWTLGNPGEIPVELSVFTSN